MNTPQQRGGQAADVDELLPCPFCGNPDAEEAESAVPTIAGGKKRAVYCNACFCEGPTANTSRQAISAWNARALTSAPPAPSVGGWMPIEEAPDGVLMLFYDAKAMELSHAFFVDWMVGGQFCGNRHHTATHCHTLPQPPKEKP